MGRRTNRSGTSRREHVADRLDRSRGVIAARYTERRLANARYVSGFTRAGALLTILSECVTIGSRW